MPIPKPLGTSEYIELMAFHSTEFMQIMHSSKDDFEHHKRSSELRMFLTLGSDRQETVVQEHIRALLNDIKNKL